jgi:hypothetical protein
VTVAQRTSGFHTPARTAWLAGAVLGVPVGVLILEGGLVGLLFLAVSGILLARSGRRFAGVGGLLVGLGATWIVLFGRVALTCSADAGCTAPSIDRYVAVSMAIAAAGLACTAAAVVRARRAARVA